MRESLMNIARNLRPSTTRHWEAIALVILSWGIEGFYHTVLALFLGAMGCWIWAIPHLNHLRDLQARPEPVDPWQRLHVLSAVTAWMLNWSVVLLWIANIKTPERCAVITVAGVLYDLVFLVAISRLLPRASSAGIPNEQQPHSSHNQGPRSWLHGERFVLGAFTGALGCLAVGTLAGIFMIAAVPPA